MFKGPRSPPEAVPSQRRWAQVLPSHTPPAAWNLRAEDRPRAGKFWGPASGAPSSFVAGLLWERAASWGKGWRTCLNYPPQTDPATVSCPPLPRPHCFSFLGW